MTAMLLTTAMVSSTPAAADEVEDCREWIEEQVADILVTSSPGSGHHDNPCVPDDIPEPDPEDVFRLVPNGPQECVQLCEPHEWVAVKELDEYLIEPKEVELWVVWCRVSLVNQNPLTAQLNTEKACMGLTSFSENLECKEDGYPSSPECIAIIDRTTPGIKDREPVITDRDPPFAICEQTYEWWVLGIMINEGELYEECENDDGD